MDRPAGRGNGLQAEHTTAYDIELQDSTRSDTYNSMDNHPSSPFDDEGRPLPKPAATWERPDYSDLEVCEVTPQTWDDGKMTVIAHDDDEKMRHTGGGMPLSPSCVDPVPAYTPAHRTTTLPLAAKGEYAEWDSRSAAPVKEEKRVLGMGMSKKKLSFVGIGVLAFILILLATVLGITLTMNIVSRQKSDTDSDASTTVATLGVHLLNDNSGIAALNWTDQFGLDRSVVFWQDRSDALMLSIRDAVSNEWTQSNVTLGLMNTTGASRLDVLSGTPLAAVTNKYQVSLYYLTSANTVAELYTPDIVGEVWYAGSLGSSLSPLVALEGSHLSAYWQLCDNCTNSLFVAFQDDSGTVQMANLTDENWEFGTVPDGLAPLSGTGLAVRPYGVDAGAGVYGTQPVDLRLYSFDSTGLVEAKYGTETNNTWEVDTASKRRFLD